MVSVRVVMEPQHHSHDTDTLGAATMSVASSALQQQQQQHAPPPQQQQQQQQQQLQTQHQQQPTTANLVSEEFSDTEDMLEGIRDKVLIEDTCDTMDLMAPTSNGVRQHW